jgi:hypothetical protein
MQPESTRTEMTCPLNGKLCKEGIRSDFDSSTKPCRWWTHVAGKDPQSEKVIDHYDCAMAWVPVVVLESSQMTRHMTATTQEFRNETNENMKGFAGAMAKAAHAIQDLADTQREMIEAVPLPSLENKENNGHEN